MKLFFETKSLRHSRPTGEGSDVLLIMIVVTTDRYEAKQKHEHSSDNDDAN